MKLWTIESIMDVNMNMNAGNYIPAASRSKQQSRPQVKELNFNDIHYLKHYNLTSRQSQKAKLRAARCKNEWLKWLCNSHV
jgi:hypothetical protein